MVTNANSILQIQPHLFMVFSGISYAQCLHYPPVKWNRWRIIQVLVALIAVDVGLETGFTLWLNSLPTGISLAQSNFWDNCVCSSGSWALAALF